MSNITEVKLHTSPVALFKVLKFEGLASSGAEAKQLVADGHVLVNGEVETRKARKLVAGDQIQLGDEVLQLVE
ncbi:RNA-binding S4 domain-containing protein [Methylophaga sp. OBS3]|uniref:RNA-binding S4 domain-containing protein n=1 Tax=Methylophaga sp. OBS3 TaxID=2991934 RepID=UPI00225043E0|nr:RNA-binding S4 domain-containing protein [Methylophaga sp. OBS3]MCX4189053.1 RNA-binding S4 domain-containing protein [Methylophaga sp. OBS3]